MFDNSLTLTPRVHQSSRYNVLNASPCVDPYDPNQELQAVGPQGHAGGRHQGQHHCPGPLRVHPTLSQEQRLQAFAEGEK